MSGVTRLAAELGDWRTRGGSAPAPHDAATPSLADRLAAALAAVIERGALDGVRLPAERRLAVELGVSRATVVHAYAELRERGLVSSRERSGTVVRAIGRRGRAPGTQLPQLQRLLAPDAQHVDLAVAAPPLDALVAGVRVELGDAAGLVQPHGYDPQGIPALRAAIAGRLTDDGLDASPDEVLVTSGAHEALSLIAALFVGRGQPVAVDAPTYPGALELFERAGGRPAIVAGDAAGMRPDALERLLARRVVALLYLMPGCRSPTGGSIARGRRPALLELAARHDLLVVEDAALDKLRFDGPLPSLRSLAPERVLRVGSLDKLAWAGLRVGWVVGPRATIARLTALKAARDLGSGILGQLAALELLRDVDRLRAARVAQARAQMQQLRAELNRRVPAWAIAVPEGGWSLWARLPRDAGVDGDALTAAAARHGVDVAAGSAHVAPPGPHDDASAARERAEAIAAVRIAYVAPPPALSEGARRLAAAWDELTQAPPDV
ncbi:PLP-dependent aminotransferase family protein [Conexibacter sp. JD483]|uniref:aminotransferase-like domain-containing protein n=1 Tax=unclassified Conexibacter TaxID=2627773 RepID=UPI0027175446|nr:MULTISPECIES: PLP-dependent aminotransferase family protein [unclassified Conexibacter]MDO8188808.1 PLP-dependent aminotransferase family protein [Conexibacter sp. CPCC 205706]MDO8201653.1 PLP-dependent aminotransferase family protein [Conexibacter sp. CPCC 205762]MDR9371337.1 PLP-dependent aminotransferase family protein [Conexibacter sp. JD483]